MQLLFRGEEDAAESSPAERLKPFHTGFPESSDEFLLRLGRGKFTQIFRQKPCRKVKILTIRQPFGGLVFYLQKGI